MIEYREFVNFVWWVFMDCFVMNDVYNIVVIIYVIKILEDVWVVLKEDMEKSVYVLVNVGK